MFYSIGIDIAKDTFKVCVLLYKPIEQSEQVLASRKFQNTSSGIKQFVSWVEKYLNKTPGPVRCTMEATGVYYERLALHIYSELPDWALSVVLASQAKKFNESEGHKNKTDKMDARGLALMGARKRLQAWRGIKPFWSKLRQLTRTRSALVEQLSELKNHLHALQHSGYTLDETIDIVQASMASLQQQVEKLERLITQHLQTDAEVAKGVGYLKSIPSVGLLTIATILGETLGFEYFTCKSQLISYSGYDVKIVESGKYVGQRKISKMGNSRIRKAMYMPVSSLLSKKTTPYYTYYMRLLAKHGIKMKAHVALQKKLLCCMYFLWKKQEYFSPQKATVSPANNSVAPYYDEATVDTSASHREAVFFLTEN